MTTPLTAVDVAALRKADSLCFDLYTDGSGTLRSEIRGIKRIEPNVTDPYAQDLTVHVAVGHSVADYGDSRADRYTCFYMVHSGQLNETWQTIARLIRTGDVLTLVWVRDNANGYTREVGLHVDELRLKIERGKCTYVLTVGHSICRDNTARMIRVERIVP